MHYLFILCLSMALVSCEGFSLDSDATVDFSKKSVKTLEV